MKLYIKQSKFFSTFCWISMNRNFRCSGIWTFCWIRMLLGWFSFSSFGKWRTFCCSVNWREILSSTKSFFDHVRPKFTWSNSKIAVPSAIIEQTLGKGQLDSSIVIATVSELEHPSDVLKSESYFPSCRTDTSSFSTPNKKLPARIPWSYSSWISAQVDGTVPTGTPFEFEKIHVYVWIWWLHRNSEFWCLWSFVWRSSAQNLCFVP